jgi:hypothetical protein
MKEKNTRRNKYVQNGGMKFGTEFKKIFMKQLLHIRPTMLTQESFDILIIETLFQHATSIRILSQRSRSSVILLLTVPSNFILDTSIFTSSNEAIDNPENEHKGVEVTKICVKLSYIYDGERTPLKFEYIPTNPTIPIIIKQTTTSHQHADEARVQNEIYQAFNCINPSSVFVPAVLGSGIMEPGDFSKLFPESKEPQIETPTQFIESLQQIASANNVLVGVIVMEYFGSNVVGSIREDQRMGHDAVLKMAALLVIIASILNIFLYDLHLLNGFLNGKLIDFGSTASLNTVTGITLIINSFENLLSNLNTDGYPTTADLCHFFHCRSTEIKGKFIKALEIHDFRQIFEIGAEARAHLHRTFMILAFVDLMINKYIFARSKKLTEDYFQMGEVLKSVYGRQVSPNSYKTFSSFLSYFTYDLPANFEHSDFRDSFLTVILEHIQIVTESCQGKAPIDPYQLTLPHWLETVTDKTKNKLVKSKLDKFKDNKRLKDKDDVLEAKQIKDDWIRPFVEPPKTETAMDQFDVEPEVHDTTTESKPMDDDEDDESFAHVQKTKPKCGRGCVMMGGTRKHHNNNNKRKNRRTKHRRYITKKIYGSFIPYHRSSHRQTLRHNPRRHIHRR